MAAKMKAIRYPGRDHISIMHGPWVVATVPIAKGKEAKAWQYAQLFIAAPRMLKVVERVIDKASEYPEGDSEWAELVSDADAALPEKPVDEIKVSIQPAPNGGEIRFNYRNSQKEFAVPIPDALRLAIRSSKKKATANSAVTAEAR